jgi:hypothetical protein
MAKKATELALAAARKTPEIYDSPVKAARGSPVPT